MRWGLGHAAVVLAVGLVIVAAGLAVPAAVERRLEMVVGAVLVGLGVWAGRNALQLHLHAPADHGGHAHLHAHAPGRHPHGHQHADPARRHRHLSTVVGAVHGLAGTAAVVALVPVTLMKGVADAIWYLTAFGFGTVVTMAAYAGIAAAAVARLETVALARILAWMTAGASVAVGVWWILSALSSTGSV